MKNPRFAVFLIVLLAPLAGIGAAHLAARISSGGLYFPAKSSIDIPDGAVGLWNQSNVMRSRNTSGTDYPVGSPWPSPSPEPSDTFTAGSGTALKTDSKSTGGIGTTGYTFQDLVNRLKVQGILVQ